MQQVKTDRLERARLDEELERRLEYQAKYPVWE